VNKPYVMITEDGGKTWSLSVNGVKSDEVARVIREDVKSPNLLYLGTETGVYYSIDRAKNWLKITDKGLPTVSVYDIKIHERDNDLIIGTHGRGIFIMDDISPLQNLANGLSTTKIDIPTQKPTIDWYNVSRGGQRGHFLFAGENPKNIRNTSNVPRAEFEVDVPISFIVNEKNVDEVSITISSLDGQHQVSKKMKPKFGVNRWYWNRIFDSKEYTASELTMIQSLFEKAAAVSVKSRVETGKNQFNLAKTSYDKRRIMTNLNESIFGGILPKSILLPRAEVGSYLVKIELQGQSVTQSFSIFRDKITGLE
jgi:predicted RNA-binding protein YlqC (UPF0109 family)